MVYIPIGADIVDEARAGKKKKNPLVPDPQKSSKTQLLKDALSPKSTTYGQRLVGIAEGTLTPPQPKTSVSSVVEGVKSGIQSMGVPTHGYASQGVPTQGYSSTPTTTGGVRTQTPSNTTTPAYQSTAQSGPSTTSQSIQTL